MFAPRKQHLPHLLSSAQRSSDDRPTIPKEHPRVVLPAEPVQVPRGVVPRSLAAPEAPAFRLLRVRTVADLVHALDGLLHNNLLDRLCLSQVFDAVRAWVCTSNPKQRSDLIWNPECGGRHFY